MGMLLTEQPDYFGETTKASHPVWIVNKLKKAGDFLLTYSPIMWLLFFALLAILVNRLGG